MVVPDNYAENKATPTYTGSTMLQLYMRQKLYKPQPTPPPPSPPITDRSF